MADLRSAAREIYSLELLSDGKSCVHRRHALAKMASALVFIVAVISFDRYEIGGLVPYVFYPVVIAALSGAPWKLLGRRAALALPLVLLAGVSNIIFDRAAAFMLGGLTVTCGMLSFVSILLRTFLCVSAVLLLVASTPFWDMSDQLRFLRLPEIFITIFEMTYRYIGTLLAEASAMRTAYALRNPDRKGLEMRHMGAFTGQLLIRSYARAERVYSAMKCRGYAARDCRRSRARFTTADWLYLAAVCVPCAVFRIIDVTALWSKLWEALL